MSRRFTTYFGALLAGILLPAIAAANSTPFASDDTADNFGSPLVVDVLTNDGDADGEALVVSANGAGPGCVTTCVGNIEVLLGVIRFEPASTRPAACVLCYSIADESGAQAHAKIVISPGAPVVVFADDFESGNTSHWSETLP